jgi:hypothetical protein
MSNKNETQTAAIIAATTQGQNLPTWMAGIAGTLDHAMAAGKVIIESGFAPKGYDRAQAVVVACAMGARLGLDPFSAMAGIAVVNGRPTLYGDAMLAVCQSHPAFEDIAEVITGTGDSMAATVTVKRKGRSPYASTFSVADAKQANLWGKQGPWSQQPKRMMMMRARAFALRGAFADALAGFHAREEMEDSEPIDVTATAVVRPATPEPARVAAPAVSAAVSVDQPATPANAAGFVDAVAAKAPAPAAPAAHPAIAAARELYRNLGTHGRDIIARVCRLHGANDPKGIPADKLDAFGKGVADLMESQGELAAIEDKLGGWELAAREEGAQS